MRLTLALARDTYPQDALVKVLVTLRNVSGRTVWLEGGNPPLPGSSFPQVEVLSTAGKILFPPALAGWFSVAGPIPSYVPIAPGKGIKEQPYVILRGPSLRVTVPILKNNRSLVPVSTVTAPPVHIGLTASDAPQVHILGSAEKASARIKQMELVTGKLLYEDAALCGGNKYEQHIGWTRMYRELTAGCSPLQIWHLVVGRLDHSVAIVNYVPPRGPACMESFWGGAKYFCHVPSALPRVLKKLTFHPLDPQVAVAQTTGLSLSQVIEFHGRWDHPIRRANGIEYIFGRSVDELLPFPATPEPKWVLISEGRSKSVATAFSMTGGQAQNVTDTSGKTVVEFNPWTLSSNLPHHHLGLLISSNEDRQTVERIATLLQQADAR